jgi:hypothetical protein
VSLYEVIDVKCESSFAEMASSQDDDSVLIHHFMAASVLRESGEKSSV